MKNTTKKIPRWARPKLEELKRRADAIWHMSDTVHYLSGISEWDGHLYLELGPKDRKDIPESWHWFSVGHVVPVPGKKKFEYNVRYNNNVYVVVDGWDELVNTLKDDLAEYNGKMMNALRRKLEQDIDSLPG